MHHRDSNQDPLIKSQLLSLLLTLMVYAVVIKSTFLTIKITKYILCKVIDQHRFVWRWSIFFYALISGISFCSSVISKNC